MAAIIAHSIQSGVDASISGALQDALVEALVLPPDPRARSAVICRVIQEMRYIVECLSDSETPGGRSTEQELMSLRQLSGAAHDHRLRMTFKPATGMRSR